MSKWRQLDFSVHPNHLIYVGRCNDLVSFVIHSGLSNCCVQGSGKPRKPGHSPWGGQFGYLTLFNDLHDSIKGEGSKDNRAFTHTRIIQNYDDLVFIVSFDTGNVYVDQHETRWFNQNTSNASNGR